MAKLGISTGTTPNDGTGDNLLSGAVKINSNFNELYTLLGNGTNLSSGIVTSIVAGTGVTISGATGQVTINATGGSGTNYWSQTSAGINTLSNVGIGTTNPTSTLTVGAVGASGNSLLVNGNITLTGYVSAGGTIGASGLTIGTGGTVITTTATGLVGIGTTNPTSALTVKGNTSLQNLNVTGVSTFTDNIEFVPSVYGKYIKLGGNNTVYLGSSNEVSFYRYEGLPNPYTAFYSTSGDFRLTAGNGGFSFSAGGSTPYAVFDGSGTALYHKGNDIAAVTLRYNTTDTGTEIYKDFSVKVNNGNDLFVVKSPGSGLTTDAKVGIGTTNPTSTLTVRGGDISVGISTAAGLILTSPDGTKYRLFAENGGTLKTIVVP
jgi:hypothetical protein